MGIPIGKLSLYTALAGIHPHQCMPVQFDVGTDNEELRSDPLYLGVRRPRLRGAAYHDLMEEFVDSVQDAYPRALIQFEDFLTPTAYELLREGDRPHVLAGGTRAGGVGRSGRPRARVAVPATSVAAPGIACDRGAGGRDGVRRRCGTGAAARVARGPVGGRDVLAGVLGETRATAPTSWSPGPWPR